MISDVLCDAYRDIRQYLDEPDTCYPNDDPLTQRGVVAMKPLVIAAATHDHDIDLPEELVEGQLVGCVETGAGHWLDPVVTPALVSDVAVQAHR